MSIGTNGKIEIYEHFLGYDLTAGAVMSGLVTDGITRLNKLITVASSSGAITQTIDEPGGLLLITLDTVDNSNCVVSTECPFKPADGGVWMETRFKTTVDVDSDVAMYAGFQETRSSTTPVMPAEFATESFAYNAAGSFAGLQYDVDATTNDWRAVGGEDASPAWDADSDETRVNDPAVSDKFDIVRVEINPHGDVDIWHAGSRPGGLVLVKHASAVVTPTDLLFPVLFIENRSDTASTLEVDYFNCGGYIDWTQ